MNRKEKAQQTKNSLRMLIREHIRAVFCVNNSGTAQTIVDSIDIIEALKKDRPHQKELIENIFEKEISPVISLLKMKLQLI